MNKRPDGIGIERFHQTAEYEYFIYQYDLLDDVL